VVYVATETASGANTQNALDVPLAAGDDDDAESAAVFDEREWMRVELTKGISGAVVKRLLWWRHDFVIV
jgi:hypothetical protein